MNELQLGINEQTDRLKNMLDDPAHDTIYLKEFINNSCGDVKKEAEELLEHIEATDNAIYSFVEKYRNA